MILYSQRDKHWKDKKLGFHTTLTLGDSGCVVTCLAMIACYYGKDTNPDKLNEDLKRIDGFEGGLYKWKALTRLYPDIGYARFVDTPDPVSPEQFAEIDAHLTSGHLVLVEVDMIPSTAKVDMHYVLMVRKVGGGYEIADPWTGTLRRLSDYGIARFTIQRYILYTGEDMSRRDAITAVYKGILGHEPSKADLDRWDASGQGIDICAKELLASLEYPQKIDKLNAEIASNKKTLEERDGIISDHLKKIGSLEETIEKRDATILSNEEKADQTVKDTLKKLEISETALLLSREETKTANKGWQEKYDKLITDLVNQDEAIEEGITQTCKISQTFQTRWQSASGITWIIEGFARLFKGR